jgi:hypothetical protein
VVDLKASEAKELRAKIAALEAQIAQHAAVR